MPRAKKVDSTKPAQAPSYQFAGLEGEGTVSWSEVDAGVIRAYLAAVTGHGDASVFGRSSDGGALVLSLLAGEQRIRKFMHTPAEAEQFMRQATEWALDATLSS